MDVFPLGPLAAALVAAAIVAVVADLTARHDSRTLDRLAPTTPIGVAYAVLLVGAYLASTGLSRYAPVRLLSYGLALPWYAVRPLARPGTHLLSPASLAWTLVGLLATLAWLYLLAALLGEGLGAAVTRARSRVT